MSTLMCLSLHSMPEAIAVLATIWPASGQFGSQRAAGKMRKGEMSVSLK